MKKSIAFGFALVALVVSLGVGSAWAGCYHCYVDEYGNKHCHDDCSCVHKH